MTEQANDFRYINLNEVDPNFDLLDPQVYTFRISKAELRPYTVKTANPTQGLSVGDQNVYVNIQFTVTNDPKFSGRKHYESLFPSRVSFKNLRKIQDTTGIPQTSTMEDWLKSLSDIQPSVKLKIDKVEDVRYVKGADGKYTTVANEHTANADGTPSLKNAVDWKAGVMQAE
jgi:hypothetical protein